MAEIEVRSRFAGQQAQIEGSEDDKVMENELVSMNSSNRGANMPCKRRNSKRR